MTMITPSYLGETIEYSSLHACRSTLEDPTDPHRGHGDAERHLVLALLGIVGAERRAGINLSRPLQSTSGDDEGFEE